MDPFDFAALKVGDIVSLKFGTTTATGRVVATYVTDEDVPPGKVRLTINGNDFNIPHENLYHKLDVVQPRR